MANIPNLLLAAGSSERMGQAKQLLPWQGKTLIEHQIEIRLKTGQPLFVVLGGHADKISQEIEKFPVTILINNDWIKGMGNSLAFGVKQIVHEFQDAEGILISLVDQPLVTSTHLKSMNHLFQIGHNQMIVSQSNSGWKGAPVLFDRYYFEELKQLDGNEGAKKIIQKYHDSVTSIVCNNLLDDIDTLEDYKRMMEKSMKKL